MADTKISALTALTGANVAPDDVLAIVDTSVPETKSITREEFQTYDAGTFTTDKKVLDLSVTWNNAAVTFTGIKFNVTDTASATASLLLDLQVGGVSKFVVKKNGRVVTANEIYGGNTLTAAMWGLTGAGLFAAAGRSIGWSSSGTFNEGVGTIDVRLERDAAATLAQRNLTTAQTFHLYNTYTDASNYERGFMRWASNVLEIGPEAAGTGTNRALALTAPGAIGNRIAIDSNFVSVYAYGTKHIDFYGPGAMLSLRNSMHIGWTSGVAAGSSAQDTGITRVAAGVLKITNGSTGGGSLDFIEQTAPAAPATNSVRIYAQDNGAGKTQLMALFATGAAQQLAIEP